MVTRLTARRTVVQRRLTAFTVFAFMVIGFLSQPSLASAQTTLEGPFDDGCYYLWDGAQYTSGSCPQADGSFDFYFPGAAGEWDYVGNFWDDTSGVRYWTWSDGSTTDIYPNGSSLFIGSADGTYIIRNSAGTATEMGNVDAQGNLVKAGYLDISTGIFMSVNTGGGGALSQTQTQSLNTDIFDAQMQTQESANFGVCLSRMPDQDFDNDGWLESSDTFDHCQD